MVAAPSPDLVVARRRLPVQQQRAAKLHPVATRVRLVQFELCRLLLASNAEFGEINYLKPLRQLEHELFLIKLRDLGDHKLVFEITSGLL